MRLTFFYKSIFLFFLLWMATGTAWAQSTVPSRNDHIFPSAPKAKSFIDYDNKGFIINGKRTFIASAGMEYARVPRALWQDRLLRLKRGGYNAVEIYTFWNYHEAKEGQFNFTGDHDLNAFLKLVKSMGMYAIVRVGPYYCGEWNMGGYPVWLRFKPGMRMREDNPQFLATVDKFFDKLIPIVSSNQVIHGGPVIMVQLENEHRAAWGTVTPNGYFRHLIDKTVSLGLQVPYFFSGLHSGNDPAGDVSNLDDPKRPNPWFSTEYWGVWFLNYGPQPQDSAIYDRRTWKIIAHGGNGYNVYMAHGGTNFDYNNDRDMAASYDYGASVGQAGDLRPLYYSFKRANWFARSFQNILTNSTDAGDNKPTVSDTAIQVTVRKSPAGSIAFLDNVDSVQHRVSLTAPVGININAATVINLAAGEIMPVVQNYQLTPEVKIKWAPIRVYSIIPQGRTTTLLVYGEVGSVARVYFSTTSNSAAISSPKNFDAPQGSGLINFKAEIASDKPTEYSFTAAGHRVRIIVVNNALVQRSWFLQTAAQTHIIIGPNYAEDIINKNTKLTLLTESPWGQKTNSPIWIFKPAGNVIRLNPKPAAPKHLTRLKTDAWQTKDASQAAQPDYDDSAWKQSTDPLQMGADGDITANAWYRTKIKVTQTGNYTLQFKRVLDRAALFLDGKRIDTGEVFSTTQNLHLTSGMSHSLALFTAHDGRNKLIFKVGVIDTLDAKGLSGPVTLQKVGGEVIKVTNWRMKGGPGDVFSKTGWKALNKMAGGSSDSFPGEGGGSGKIIRQIPPYTPPKEGIAQAIPASFTNSPQFYHTTFTLPALKGMRTVWRVNTTSLSYGSVWVNGHNLGRYPEKIRIGGHYIPECWLKDGVNTIVIYDENGVSPAKVSVEAEAKASRDTQHLQF